RKLARLGLETIRDLLEHRPFRYEEPVPGRRIAELRGEDEVVIAAEVLSVSERRRGRLKILTARGADESGAITATWFNQPWLKAQLQPGTRIRLRGKPGRYGFDVRSYDVGETSATADFAPVYPASEEITPKKLRELVEAALPRTRDFPDPLPAELRQRLGLPLVPDALTALHRPRRGDDAEVGRRRLAFDELLAFQLTIEPLCGELGVPVALLTGTTKGEIADAGIVVGTHALIQEGVELRDLAVAVVDEQHRFGVEQRRRLAEGRSPHVLHMTATPIPRTLALTVYGDLAVSEIAKPPASRKPIVTAWIPQERASAGYRRLTRLLDEGRQAYVVCPLIEASEASLARAAEDEAERLRRAELRGYRVGCVHGRLRPRERRGL